MVVVVVVHSAEVVPPEVVTTVVVTPAVVPRVVVVANVEADLVVVSLAAVVKETVRIVLGNQDSQFPVCRAPDEVLPDRRRRNDYPSYA